jgi:uncharacterized protein YkwD
MGRGVFSGFVAALSVLLLAPAGAQARATCPAEQTALTSANGAQAGDAIFCLTNQVRASYGLPAFRRDVRLDAAALLHSQDMDTRHFFAHVTPDGLTPSDRAAAQGYTTGAGENIAQGFPTPTAVVLAWMASAGHCRNILGSARDIGIGASGAGPSYYTQSFGAYGVGASGPASDGCPYALNLDTLDALETTSGATPPATSPPQDPTPEPAAPVAGPALSKLAVSRATLRAGGRGRLAYMLSAPATVTFRIERVLAGRRAGGRCVTTTASNRSAAVCSRDRTLAGSLTDSGEQGANAFVFRARLSGRPLAPGRYRLRAVATDDAGSASTVRLARFLVVSPLRSHRRLSRRS